MTVTIFEGFLVTIDTEKVFDSLDHKFILAVLKKIGFGKNFLSWIEPLLNNQESCVINGCITTRYFPLQRGTRQGNPVSPYVFILCLEILFIPIKNDPNNKGIEIFKYCYLYTAYADDTTFFLKDENSIVHLSEKLKPNTTKCEVAGISVLKEVQVAICGMKCTELRNEAIKILGVYFSYNQKIKDDKNVYNIISNIQRVLNLWRMRNLTLEGRIVVFKMLAISKKVFLALLTKIPHQAVKELEKIQKSFLWKDNSPKIRHETTCKEQKDGGLKNVDILYKIVRLQCFWIRKLYDNSFDEWKLIPLYLIAMSFGSKFKFYSNVF